MDISDKHDGSSPTAPPLQRIHAQSGFFPGKHGHSWVKSTPLLFEVLLDLAGHLHHSKSTEKWLRLALF
jgi:hypothetical protein